MRNVLQTLYHSNGLGQVPEPTPSRSIIDQDHLDVLTELKPEVASFHFGLPHQDVVDQLKALGTLIVCSATTCLLYTSPSPRDATLSRMPSSA